MRRVLGLVASLSLAFPSSVLAADPKPAATAAATATPAPTAAPTNVPGSNPVPAAAIAAPPPRVRSEHQVTPLGSIWRSALIPGWGQRYKGEVTKGWVMTGVAGGLVATSLLGFEYKQSTRQAYNDLKSDASAKTFDDKYKTSVNAALGFDFVAAATAGWWAYNISDSAFTPLEHLRIKDARLRDVFPAQYKYYQANPFATISLENRSSETVSKVKIKIEAKEIMDQPAESQVVEMIPAGLGKSLTATATFNDKIFEIGMSEPRQIPAKVTIEYEVGAKKRKIERTATFTVYNRNAIVWDDMRRLASFVTPKDDAVKNFVSAAIQAQGKKEVSSVKKISLAATFFEALGAYKLSYLPDPASPFSYVEGNSEAVDTVSFPRETLVRRTGDCDDLTSVYAAILEAAGVATGLVDVPGHVFVVFDTEMTEDEIKRYIGNAPVAYQMRGGSAWIPIEVTAVGKSFTEAWTAASTEYKKWSALKKFNVVETEPSQQEFPPAAPTFQGAPPDTNAFRAAIETATFTRLASIDHDKMTGSEDKARKDAIAAIKAKRLSPASEANEVGIVMAKDGQFDDAEKSFRQAIGIDPKLAKAHNNLANILYLQQKNKEAADEYEKALETGGENAAILANLSNLYYEIGEPEKSKKFFERCLRIEPLYEAEFPELAALIKPSGEAVAATGGTKPNGVSKASNIGAGERDPRKSRWIP